MRQHLHHETDYRAEARHATAYRALLGDDPVLHVPAVAQVHCTDHILATEFVVGIAVDRLAQASQPQAWRDHVALALERLSVRELFDMRLVQTDPNFGNYLFDAATGRVALLDFGATEAVTPERVEQLRELGGVYDFGASELFGRVFDQGRTQMLGEGYARTPPPDLLFLQRKFAGTFMLYSRLQARLDIGVLFGGHL